MQSVKHVLETFKKFRICAGFKVNVDKIKAKCLGSMKTPNNCLSNHVHSIVIIIL